MERRKEVQAEGTQVDIFSYSAIDKGFENADWIYDFTNKLETLATADHNKKDTLSHKNMDLQWRIGELSPSIP